VLLSFVNLVEAHVLHAIRHVHEVKLRKVRHAFPRISFGRPIIVGSGIPTSVILERYHERYHAGEGFEHLAKDYRLSPEQIEEAVRCETSRA
jgi:uncharacterized protein (DUF433 family)